MCLNLPEVCYVIQHRSNFSATNISSPPTPTKSSTPLSRSFAGNSNTNNRPPRGHPLLFNSNIADRSSNVNRTLSLNMPCTPTPLHKNSVNKPNTPVASRNRLMEPRNLANMLTSGESYDLSLPSEEEQLKWALNESKALLESKEDSEDDDPDMARALEESKALYEQCNSDNRHTPSPEPSPSLLGGGAEYTGCNSNNNTEDSGYCGSSINLTLDDELQHKVGRVIVDCITPTQTPTGVSLN